MYKWNVWNYLTKINYACTFKILAFADDEAKYMEVGRHQDMSEITISR